ncbi:MAG: HU family DNA-binding protein [Selenomonadaceae bacterium]|nr:HU family DNA-binding protein [Selenomonadaceae bacterium]
MTKTDLVASVAEKSGLDKKEAASAVKGLFTVIEETLAVGEKIQLIGFGTFEVRDIAARKGRMPVTGEPIDLPARKNPAFRPGKLLKDAVNRK